MCSVRGVHVGHPLAWGRALLPPGYSGAFTRQMCPFTLQINVCWASSMFQSSWKVLGCWVCCQYSTLRLKRVSVFSPFLSPKEEAWLRTGAKEIFQSQASRADCSLEYTWAFLTDMSSRQVHTYAIHVQGCLYQILGRATPE